jgi:hypothetical protein
MAVRAAEDPPAIIVKYLARRLWAALKARDGGEAIRDFLSQDAMEILDPTYQAAAILLGRGIYVEPCRRLIPGQPLVYLATWPGGASRNITEAELLELAGLSSPPVR